MDESFVLNLPVSHVDKSLETSGWDKESMRVTLRHTLAHIRHLIWSFSPKHELQSLSLLFLYFSKEISDSLLLSEIFSVNDPRELSAVHGLSLVADYTDPPAVTKIHTVPELFDVEVVFQRVSSSGDIQRCFSRESLFSSVLSIKELVAVRFNLAPEDIEMRYKEQTLEEKMDLREVLKLDVPPLYMVQLGLQRTTARCPVYVEAKQPQDISLSFTMHVDRNILIQELIAEIARQTAVSADQLELYTSQHCFSRMHSKNNLARLLEFIDLEEAPETVPEVKYVVKTGVETSESELESRNSDATPTSAKPSEPKHEAGCAQRKPVRPSSELYQLEYKGRSFEFTTAECILTPDGSLLLNAHAMAKLALLGINFPEGSHSMGSNSGALDGTTFQTRTEPPTVISSTSSETRYFTDSSAQNSGHVMPEITARNEDIETPTVGPSSNSSDPPDASHSNVTMGPNQEPERVVEEPAIPSRDIEDEILGLRERENGSALGAIIHILNDNRAFLLQLVLQIGFTMFLMGGDLFYELLDPMIFAILGVASAMIAFFIFGIEISDWINENVLLRGNENLLDHAILNCVSILFRSATSIHVRTCNAISLQCVRIAARLHKTRIERLEEQVFGNSFLNAFKCLLLQNIQALFMGAATIFPFLEHDLARFFEEVHRREGEDLRKVIQKILCKLKASENLARLVSLAQAQLRVPIHTLADVDAPLVLGLGASSENEEDEVSTERARSEENEDLLRCYLLLKWLERHTDALELPLMLRRERRRE
ncbi:hypothetical protein METBIDRAFT_179494 [Metschnikowia bicuspidata var. bicuspidata NRRL YB-4993]|uniref:Ubiquitin-like domain-containing protein n=1 Tax=Metschnikowia bicuspidata var. bicuspidata NRRL YB-4993 TaxID=869754 RepID=A0A1A0HBA7_9ASCO|nr:hypothetical protein METBIDRAFT_179494 [Metschnikowia bicuspidata var. bicuspidata NRRL YB-4993]OBA21296.1 hypothetical protein METBIDRAFT_179494 [Metschnikowia bicuspidata var. bicuspidata NRRL YB-4993]